MNILFNDNTPEFEAKFLASVVHLLSADAAAKLDLTRPVSITVSVKQEGTLPETAVNSATLLKILQGWQEDAATESFERGARNVGAYDHAYLRTLRASADLAGSAARTLRDIEATATVRDDFDAAITAAVEAALLNAKAGLVRAVTESLAPGAEATGTPRSFKTVTATHAAATDEQYANLCAALANITEATHNLGAV